MFKHSVHGLSARLEVEHGGETLAVEFTRPEAAFASPCTMTFRCPSPGMFEIGSPVQRGDGLLWTPIAHGGSTLWLRRGYFHRDPRLTLFLDAPREWAFRWGKAHSAAPHSQGVSP